VSDLAEAAEHLYGVPPEDFVSERTERVARAKADGDKQLAASVARLPKPTTAAWLLNQLVREHPDQVSELISLGDALRKAQESLAGPQLRQLSQQRHEVIAGFTRRALAPARSAGRAVTADLTVQVQETLSAAIADPAAGEALLSGRLTKGLSYAGLGDVSTTTSGRRASTQPTRRQDRSAEQDHKRRIREAAAEVERLSQAAGTAAEEVERAHREAQENQARSQSSAARLEELRAELAQQETALAAAQASAAETARRAVDARRVEEELQQELAGAKQRLAEVEGD
jgi:hypothetical protein